MISGVQTFSSTLLSPGWNITWPSSLCTETWSTSIPIFHHPFYALRTRATEVIGALLPLRRPCSRPSIRRCERASSIPSGARSRRYMTSISHRVVASTTCGRLYTLHARLVKRRPPALFRRPAQIRPAQSHACREAPSTDALPLAPQSQRGRLLTLGGEPARIASHRSHQNRSQEGGRRCRYQRCKP